jgi:hypothetical protein
MGWTLPRRASLWAARGGEYVGYLGAVLAHAARPTARFMRDLRVEFIVLAAGVVVAVLSSEGQGSAPHQLIVGGLWVLAILALAVAIVFVWNLLLAPARLHIALKDELAKTKSDAKTALEAAEDRADAAEFQSEGRLAELRIVIDEVKGVRKELERVQRSEKEDKISAVARQIGTELRDIRHKIEIVRVTRPHPHYSDGFQLPAARWDEYDEVLAEDADLYGAVEAAYTAAHHVNEALDMRRTRAGAGVTVGVGPDDGLDAAYDAAGEALDALKQERGEVWETEADRAVRLVAEDIVQELGQEETRSR